MRTRIFLTSKSVYKTDGQFVTFTLGLDLKKLRLWKLLDFMLNFILFQTFCKINLSFFCLIKLCFVWKRKCILFIGGKTNIAKEEADNPLHYWLNKLKIIVRQQCINNAINVNQIFNFKYILEMTVKFVIKIYFCQNTWFTFDILIN